MILTFALGCSNNPASSNGAPDGGAGTGGGSGGQGVSGGATGGSATGGSGGATGGSGGAAGAPQYTPSAELQHQLDEANKLLAGQPADFSDGDGTAERYAHEEPRRLVHVLRRLRRQRYTRVRAPGRRPGQLSASIDSDQDGVPEQEIDFTTTSSMQKEVLTVDSDLDGVMDHRYTWVTQAATPAVQSYTEEADANQTGNFTVVQTLTLTKTKNAGPSCEGLDGFPSGGSDFVPAFPAHVTIKRGSGSGECSTADSASIAKAVDCALSKGGLCLANTNTREYNSLMAAAYGDSMKPLDIACGNTCAGVAAATRGWSAPWFTDSKMNLNMTEWNKLDDAGRCNLMLHEMMHWAGDQGSADHNDNNGPGHDAVYSCGRYCGGCSNALHGAPGNSSVDCAYCADTTDRKQQCGTKTQSQQVPCGSFGGGLCHAGLGCIAGQCQTCGGDVTKACDGTTLAQAATCCQACPSSCNQSNDVPCGSGSTPTDTCTPTNPPFCK